MKKKYKIPFPFRIIRWLYPIVESIFPKLAHWYFMRFFFSPLRYRFTSKEKKAATYATHITLPTASANIHVYQWGNPAHPYVLLMHGWSGRALQFRRFIKPLVQNGYKVLAFDGPAHGRSSGKRTNLIAFEEALHKIYDTYGVPHAVVAHSFGGSAILFAAMNGMPVSRLITIATPSISDEIIKNYTRALQASPKTVDYFKKYFQSTYHKSFDEFSALHFINHLPSSINWLIIQDEHDREVTLKHALAMHNAYPAATSYTTTGLGHTRILKDDQVINKCISFINA